MPVFEMRLLINHRFFVFMGRIDIHHLNLALRVVDSAGLILVTDKLLST